MAGPSRKMMRNKIEDSLAKIADDDLSLTAAKQLGEDELALIFRSQWISPQDLLNFRLVNKSWRNAATNTLLQRDALTVALDLKTTTTIVDWCNRVETRFYKLINCGGKDESCNEHFKMSQLTDLISKSPKFPASNFQIGSTSSDCLTRYTDYPDLVQFFKLHGEKIKTLRPHGMITYQFLFDIFFIYTPSLECLNLCGAQLMTLKNKANKREWNNALQQQGNLKILPFKSVAVGDFLENYCKDNIDKKSSRCAAATCDLLSLLLSSPSKLNWIDNVTRESLPIILSVGRGHMIRSCTYNYFQDVALKSNNSLLTKLIRTYPKLTSVTLHIERTPHESFLDTGAFNDFAQLFKNTVENMELDFTYYSTDSAPQFKIPPMKHLKCIKLSGYYWWQGGSEQRDIDELRAKCFAFEDQISAENYFPRLLNICLNSPRGSVTEVHLISFFKFRIDQNSTTTTTTCGSLPKVESLDIVRNTGLYETPCLDKQSPALFNQIFPNLRVLKFQCGHLKNLNSSLWGLSHKVEFMEIYDIFKNPSCLNVTTRINILVNKYFTGFSLGMCRTLQTTEPPQEMDTPEMLKFLRAAPSVCDLSNLRELKLKFSETLSTEFASHVTGTYAFSKMPNTKFIISYNPRTLTLGQLQNVREIYVYRTLLSDDITTTRLNLLQTLPLNVS